MENYSFQTGETGKTRSYSKARREKASALTRLRIAFFIAAGGLLLQSYGVILSVIPLLFFWLVDNSEKFLNFS